MPTYENDKPKNVKLYGICTYETDKLDGISILKYDKQMRSIYTYL